MNPPTHGKLKPSFTRATSKQRITNRSTCRFSWKSKALSIIAYFAILTGASKSYAGCVWVYAADWSTHGEYTICSDWADAGSGYSDSCPPSCFSSNAHFYTRHCHTEYVDCVTHCDYYNWDGVEPYDDTCGEVCGDPQCTFSSEDVDEVSIECEIWA